MATNRKRNERIMICVDRKEKDCIKKLANKADMSVSDYARKVLTGKIKNEYEAENNG